MKILLTTISPNLDGDVDPRFGRSAYLIAVDSATMEWRAHPNPGVGASGGAGTLAAQFASNLKAGAVISGDFGPNAYNALHAAGVEMFRFGACRTGREAVEQFKAEKLEGASGPSSQGHHGRG